MSATWVPQLYRRITFARGHYLLDRSQSLLIRLSRPIPVRKSTRVPPARPRATAWAVGPSSRIRPMGTSTPSINSSSPTWGHARRVPASATRVTATSAASSLAPPTVPLVRTINTASQVRTRASTARPANPVPAYMDAIRPVRPIVNPVPSPPTRTASETCSVQRVPRGPLATTSIAFAPPVFTSYRPLA